MTEVIAFESPAQAELVALGAAPSPVELRLPDGLPLQDWAAIGRKLLRAEQVMQWWIGDWAAFGERKYGQLKEFCDGNGFQYQTVKVNAWVSGSVHLTLRGAELPWSYFKEVAALKPREQKQWLGRATTEDLSVADLRRAIRIAGGEHNALESDGPIIEYGTRSFDDLKAWLRARPAEFWLPERAEIWRNRIAELQAEVG